MSHASIDPRWADVLSLSGHELRNSLSVASGYLRFLVTNRAGPLTEPQLRFVNESLKACARMSALLDEVSLLGNLERGEASFHPRGADLYDALRQAVEELPAMPDGREIPIELDLEGASAPVHGDPSQLKRALGSIIAATRREVGGGVNLTVRGRRTPSGYELHVGTPETLTGLAEERDGDRGVFDEWRGGSGLSLPIARRIINRHGGQVFAPPDGHMAGARIVFGEMPESSAPISDS